MAFLCYDLLRSRSAKKARFSRDTVPLNKKITYNSNKTTKTKSRNFFVLFCSIVKFILILTCQHYYFLMAPEAFQEAPFLHFWDFTIFVVFVATASPSNMITLKLANRSLFMITNF